MIHRVRDGRSGERAHERRGAAAARWHTRGHRTARGTYDRTRHASDGRHRRGHAPGASARAAAPSAARAVDGACDGDDARESRESHSYDTRLLSAHGCAWYTAHRVRRLLIGCGRRAACSLDSSPRTRETPPVAPPPSSLRGSSRAFLLSSELTSETSLLT